MKQKTEILILGKIGSGKSSLINYLLDLKESDLNYCEVGEGKRTTARGIFKKEGELNGIKYNLYDSMGLETSQENEKKKWFKMLDYIFNPYLSIDLDYDFTNVEKPEKEYFDCIFYCIKADAKLEEEDINIQIIKKLEEEYKNNVIVVLTNCDRTEAKKILALEKELKIYSIIPIKVSSVESESQSDFGVLKSKKVGKELIICEIIINSIDNLVKYLCDNIIKSLKKEIAQDIDKMKAKIVIELETNNIYDFDSLKNSIEEKFKNLDEIFNYKSNIIINREYKKQIEDLKKILSLFSIEKELYSKLDIGLNIENNNNYFSNFTNNLSLLDILGSILVVFPRLFFATSIFGLITLGISSVLKKERKKIELKNISLDLLYKIEQQIYKDIDEKKKKLKKDIEDNININTLKEKIRLNGKKLENLK